MTPRDIQSVLNDALIKPGAFKECALLDHPDFLNIGDHLIWEGEVRYLRDTVNADIKYTCSMDSYSEKKLTLACGDAPIFLSGGGNLGDLYPRHQLFRENIITRFKDRPIIIFPQSVYFRGSDNLKRASMVFNSHPDLTIFTREEQSYKIAADHFYKCRVLLAPDMSFQLLDEIKKDAGSRQKDTTLYLSRSDNESDGNFSSRKICLPGMTVNDWVFYRNVFLSGLANRHFAWLTSNTPALLNMTRDIFRRRIPPHDELRERERWKRDSSSVNSRSLDIIHAGIYQLSGHGLVVTDRLHAHILCLLLGIRNILLPNSYHKNESFYRTWTRSLPLCRFANEPRDVITAWEELNQCPA